MKMLKLGVALLAMTAVWAQPAAAAVIEWNLNWDNAPGSFTGSGSFTYDDTAIGTDNLVTGDELLSLNFNVFDGSGSQVQTFTLASASAGSAFSFNFETDTGTIRSGAVTSFPSSTAFLLQNGLAVFGGDTFCGSFLIFTPDELCGVPAIQTGGTLTASPVSPVPVPATVGLLALGLAGLGALGSRREAKSALTV